MNKIIEKEVECSAEYILSDYMGDVKRVLLTRASAIPNSGFVSDNEAEFTGTVEFEIFYSDVDGKLTTVKAGADYEVVVPIEEGALDASCGVSVSNFSVRLTGPRKLSLRATVAAEMCASFAETSLPSGGVFEEGREPEKITKTVSSETSVYAKSDSRELYGDVPIAQGVEYDGVEILFTSGSVRITETEAMGDFVLVKGELVITSIIRNEDDPPFAIRKVIPFEERVGVEGMTAEGNVSATGYVLSTSSALKTDEDKSTVALGATVQFFVSCSKNDSCEVITDAYLPHFDVASLYEEECYSELVCLGSVCEFVTLEVPREEECINIRDVLASSVEIRSLEKKLCDNGFEISGEIYANMLGMEISEDAVPSYMQIKKSMPFALNVNTGGGVSPLLRLECKVSPNEGEVWIEEDKITAKCPVSISYRIYKDSLVRRVSRSDIIGEAKDEKKKSVICVYYPEKDDTLFGIARRFHTTVSKLSIDNSLSAECLSSPDTSSSLFGVKRLIIK